MGVGTRILVCLFLMSIAVRVANRESASEPPSLDATDRKPLCGREDLRRGKWAERTIGNATGHRWEAASAGAVPCRYHADFDRAAFCELMANVVVMFVGDSLMWEMYASMVRLTDDNNLALSKRVHLRVTYQGSRGGLPVMVNVCGNSNVTLVYRWTKHLEGVEGYLGQQPPAALVMNTGAHYQDDNSYRSNMNKMLGALDSWKKSCREQNLTCPFFWRTSPPGIPNCISFKGPVNNITEMEGVVAATPMYNWEKFKHQNQLALNMLESSSTEYEVVDGYEIGIQRPDTRASPTDCLHNGSPDIADAENAVLLHYLRTYRTADDVSAVSRHRYDFDRGTNVNAAGTDLEWSLVNRKDYPY